jgi:hypothetical protein
VIPELGVGNGVLVGLFPVGADLIAIRVVTLELEASDWVVIISPVSPGVAMILSNMAAEVPFELLTMKR